MKISTHWLQTYFDAPLPTGGDIADILTMYAFEVESVERVGTDEVLDVKVLPNRAHDCLSHVGIARELSVLLNLEMKPQPVEDIHTRFSSSGLDVVINDTSLCTRYSAAIMRGVRVAESPAWLKERLEAIGQCSINNVVDATNYVMFSLGQPLHAFDLSKLIHKESGYAIAVRNAHEGETIEALDGNTYTLSSQMLVITDKHCKDNKVLGIAGIKGGTFAHIDDRTTDILLEAAHFDPISIRMTAKKLGLRTDASVRFENGFTPEFTVRALQDVCTLIVDIASGTVEALIDVRTEKKETPSIQLTYKDITSVLGVEIERKKIVSVLRALGCEIHEIDDTLSVVPPPQRLDMVIKEDVIEEVGRVYGYSNIPPYAPPSHVLDIRNDALVTLTYAIRTILISLGFSEVYTYTFTDTGTCELENPLASDKSYLRSSLKEGLNSALVLNKNNAPLLGVRDVINIFEIGKVFDEEGEHLHLGIAILPVGKIKNVESVLENTFNSVQKELEEKLGVVCTNMLSKECNTIREFDLDTMRTSMSLDTITQLASVRVSADVRFKTISPYPCMLRDIAVFVPEGVTQDVVENIITHESGPLLVRLDLFDVFAKTFEDGVRKTSYAFSLVFQSNEKTLSDDGVGEIMKKVTDTLNAQSGWQVR